MPTETKQRKQVPASITFGYKVLPIPSLEEVGVFMGGFGLCRLNERVGQGFEHSWIDRGDWLLEYDMRCFQSDEKPFLSGVLGDPLWHQKFQIMSPISGLLLLTRQEKTVNFYGSLEYVDGDESRLPVLLVPNDEPPPDPSAFYVYDRIAHFLRDHFDRLPIRHPDRMHPERLAGYLARDNDGRDFYRRRLDKLRKRTDENYRRYDIREITSQDTDLIRQIQDLRAKDIVLREKLVHLARRFGTAI